MHLDNLNKGKDDWKNKDYKKGPETRSCYNCGKLGYLSRDCRSKNKVTRQLNVLTSASEEETDEWTVLSYNAIGDTDSEDDAVYVNLGHDDENTSNAD
jgi:hypothetical protein